MKTARIALLLVMMLVLAACSERQRRSAMSGAANALLASLLEAQSNAPLTQSSFRAPAVAAEPEVAPDSAAEAESEPVVEAPTPAVCPLTQLPIAPVRLSDLAVNAAGVVERVPGRGVVLVSRQFVRAQATEAISHCRSFRVRDEKGKRMVVVRTEYTVPGSAIEISGLDDLAL